MSKSNNLILVYFGARGGGLSLTHELLTILRNKNLDTTIVRASNSDWNLYYQNTFVNNEQVIYVPRRIRQIPLFIVDLLKNARKILSLVKIPNDYLVVMPSPIDLVFCRLIRLIATSSRIAYVIHEVDDAQGQKWPKQRAIKKRARIANTVFVLNYSARNQLLPINPEIRICRLIALGATISNASRFDLPEKYYLAIGRNLPYKNFEMLHTAWKSIDSHGSKLIFAGESMTFPESENVINISKWLTPDEINYLILNAECLLIPYQVFSQSGIVSLAENLQKKVAVSSVVLSAINAKIEVFDLGESELSALTKSLQNMVSGKITSQKIDSALPTLDQAIINWKNE
jgi:hypothetical protein